MGVDNFCLGSCGVMACGGDSAPVGVVILDWGGGGGVSSLLATMK